MSLLLFLKSFGEDYLIKSVRQVEQYKEKHANTTIRVEVSDEGLYVYDRQVLLLNIKVSM